MNIDRYLATFRGLTAFAATCGLLLGFLAACYTAFFFGSRAFAPLFFSGALAGGVIVGLCCSFVAKLVVQRIFTRQAEALSGFMAKIGGSAPVAAGDLFEVLPTQNELLFDRISSTIQGVKALGEEIYHHQQTFTVSTQQTIQGNEQQAARIRETFQSVESMNAFFNELLRDIEDLAQRTEERASISTQMSATTDSIAHSVKDYSTSVLETSASIEEMVLSIKETAANISALAASTEQTSGSIKQIGTAISGVRDNAGKTAEFSEKVRIQAIEGMEAMSTTTAAMADIEGSSNETFSAIKRLASHTSRIGDFLKIIKDLVDQTNLLSLNASIIAAQAGEQGKSFTVVAEEVRALAHRTSASTKEIEDLVKNIQNETKAVETAVTLGKEKATEGVRKASGANAILKKIEDSAAEAATMVQKIAAATVDQAAASRVITDEAEKNLVRVQQVTRSIDELERGTNLIVNTLEHMRALSQRITTSTEEQSRGNRLYLKSVLEDNERVKNLRDTSIQQIMMADVVLNEMRSSASLIAGNAEEMTRIMSETELALTLIDRLQRELNKFCQ